MFEIQRPTCCHVVIVRTGIEVLPDVGGAALDSEACALGFKDLITRAESGRGTQVQIGKLVVFKTHAAPQYVAQ